MTTTVPGTVNDPNVGPIARSSSVVGLVSVIVPRQDHFIHP